LWCALAYWAEAVGEVRDLVDSILKAARLVHGGADGPEDAGVVGGLEAFDEFVLPVAPAQADHRPPAHTPLTSINTTA
jgi:hypothetical protein